MKITDLNGQYTASSLGEVEEILCRRLEANFNAFTLSCDSKEFPTLSLLVRDDIATLNYLEWPDSAGFIPTGNRANRCLSENTVFWISQYRADDVEIQNDAIVSFSAALDAAKEFFHSRDLPGCIQWSEI